MTALPIRPHEPDVGLPVPCPAPRSPLFDELGSGCQNGITDPRWPADFETFLRRLSDVEGGTVEEVRRSIGLDGWEEFRAQYEHKMAWRMRPQECLSIVASDVDTTSLTWTERRRLLRELLRKLTKFLWNQMRKAPSRYSLRPYDYVWIPYSYRVTITLAFGASLFVTRTGQNRFGLADWMPNSLRIMPRFEPADDPAFDPAKEATDLLLLVQSDHPYVNAAIARELAIAVDSRLKAKRIEHGFARPDTREWLGFNDGVANVKGRQPIESLVYVAPGEGEPDWCSYGSYLAYRKIRENVANWRTIPREEQEQMVGRRKDVRGTPLSPDPDNPKLHRYHPSGGNQGASLTAHSFKNNPRRPEPDFFGILDADRNILRRGFPYFDGLNAAGSLQMGMHFLAFMKDLRRQFEWRVEGWQLNPDFPYPGVGIDALFQHKVLQTEAGGYYFCPPAPVRPVDADEWQPSDDFFGRALLEASEVETASN